MRHGWVDRFCEDGFCVIDGFIAKEVCAQIFGAERDCWERGLFKRGRIGSVDVQTEDLTRKDWIRWLDESHAASHQTEGHKAFFAAMGDIIGALRDEVRIPVASYEFHGAVYEPGAYYKKHLDDFKGPQAGKRLVSVIYYLNPGWENADGGALRLYLKRGRETLDIMPVANRLVLFQSHLVPHEVLAPLKLRFSITGWLRRA